MAIRKPIYSQPVLDLMAMQDEVVPARCIAPILKVHASQIIDDVKNGTWDYKRQGNFIISGSRVKFYRIDFLRKGGWIQ